jgi:hypothetical protein
MTVSRSYLRDRFLGTTFKSALTAALVVPIMAFLAIQGVFHRDWGVALFTAAIAAALSAVVAWDYRRWQRQNVDL